MQNCKAENGVLVSGSKIHGTEVDSDFINTNSSNTTKVTYPFKALLLEMLNKLKALVSVFLSQ